jgi:hypothetical protein
MPRLDEWCVDSDAVWHERIGTATVSLRHPGYPAEDFSWDGTAAALRLFVARYLAKVARALDLPTLFSGNTDIFRVPLTWLKLPNETDLDLDPRDSFWVTRYDKGVHGTQVIDRTVVLFASVSKQPNDGDGVLGSRLGLRVVAHVAPGISTSRHVRITSVARSLGLREPLLHAQQISPTLQQFYNLFFNDKSQSFVASSLGNLAGLTATTSPSLDGLRVTGESHNIVDAEVYATAPRPSGNPYELAYAMTARLTFTGSSNNPDLQVHEVTKHALAAHATPPVRVDLFVPDPASKAGLGQLTDARPNRSGERLDAYTEPNVELDGVAADVNGDVWLADDLGLVRVLQSKLVDPNADESATEVVNPRDARHPRTPAFAAFSGYERGRAHFDQYHLRPSFDTVAAYGLSPYGYFRFAAYPVHVRYRAPIIRGPGKDGRTVNAQVVLDAPGTNLIGASQAWNPALLKSPEVRFALADLKRTSARRDALGLTADPRWSWHEYCHVLLGAQTGRLEFHFAHSAGDAMAAIACDPRSELAHSPWTRGYTFPWVYLHRRHDRTVADGWGWCGRRHRPNRFIWPDSNSRHKGYDSEQILSTSLFRLYRALGGDTLDAAGGPDDAARQRAADYALYLILRAIALMPAHNVGLLETPDQLVTTLVDADVATLPMTSGPLQGRVGGWAHKVIRWAFEAQGLYATTDPDQIVETPGQPPLVDIFIQSQRRDSQGTLSNGGYEPASLRWQGPGDKPWHASSDAIRILPFESRVTVRNRGSNAANGVRVSMWYTQRSATAPQPPNWRDTANPWVSLGSRGPVSVPPGGAVSLGLFGRPPVASFGIRTWVLAIAHCVDDPANTDASTALPTALATTRPSIVDLVAGDNNLGLRVL